MSLRSNGPPFKCPCFRIPITVSPASPPPLTSLFAHFFRVDVSVLILQSVKRQVPIQTDRVVVFTLVRVAAQLVGLLDVDRPVGGYDQLRRGREHGIERTVRVVTGRPAVFAEEQRPSLVLLVSVFQNPCERKTTFRSHAVSSDHRHRCDNNNIVVIVVNNNIIYYVSRAHSSWRTACAPIRNRTCSAAPSDRREA